MWDMSDDPFEADLSKLFLKPSGEADPARLRVQILERLEHEDRRRRVVIIAAAGLGAAIAAGAAGSAASGIADAAFNLAASLPVIAAPSLDGVPPLWIAAAFGMTLFVFLTGRVVRNV